MAHNIAVQQDTPFVSGVSNKHWYTTRDGQRTDHGEYPCIEVTAPHDVAKVVYGRLGDYHDDLYIARTSLETTRFSLWVAPGVNAEQVRSLVMAHVFVAATTQQTREDLARLNEIEDMGSALMNFSFDNIGNVLEVAQMVRGIIIILLRTMLKRHAEKVYETHNLRMTTIDVSRPAALYNSAVEALRRLEYTESANLSATTLKRRAATVEELLGGLKKQHDAIVDISKRIELVKEDASRLSSIAKVKAQEAVESDDAAQMLAMLDEIDALIPQVKALVQKSKQLRDEADEPWSAMQRDIDKVQRLTPPEKAKK